MPVRCGLRKHAAGNSLLAQPNVAARLNNCAAEKRALNWPEYPYF